MIDVDLIDHDSSCSRIGGPISPDMDDCPWRSGVGNVHSVENCQVSKFKSTMATTFSIFVGFS